MRTEESYAIGELDAAWREAEAALPDPSTTWLELIGPNHPSEPDRLYAAMYHRLAGMTVVSVGPWGYGTTPVAALRDLVKNKVAS